MADDACPVCQGCGATEPSPFAPEVDPRRPWVDVLAAATARVLAGANSAAAESALAGNLRPVACYACGGVRTGIWAGIVGWPVDF